jgi:hypothetical protein
VKTLSTPLPEFLALGQGVPTLAERAAAVGATMTAVQIPWDCQDGFFHSYWRRADAYLQANVGRGTSVWAAVGPEVEGRAALSALRSDLESGRWHERNRALLELEQVDLGARLLIA